jgi:hypothetical protein
MTFRAAPLLLNQYLIIKPAVKQTNFSLHFVIPAQAGIQYSQQTFWIPALRYATAGMTYLIAGLIRFLKMAEFNACQKKQYILIN